MSKPWRRWYWVCDCGADGEALEARWVVVGQRLLMLCPECNRKVDLPGTGCSRISGSRRRDHPRTLKFKALGEKL